MPQPCSGGKGAVAKKKKTAKPRKPKWPPYKLELYGGDALMHTVISKAYCGFVLFFRIRPRGSPLWTYRYLHSVSETPLDDFIDTENPDRSHSYSTMLGFHYALRSVSDMGPLELEPLLAETWQAKTGLPFPNLF